MTDHLFQPGNTIGQETRFKTGEKVEGGGRPTRFTTSVLEWWNSLCAVDAHGNSKYSVTDLEKIGKTKKSDKSVPITKRLAARQILETLKSGQLGRKMSELMFNRLDGSPRQAIDLNANVFEQRVIVLCGSSHLQAQGDKSVPALPDELSYIHTLPDGQQVCRPISELPNGDSIKSRIDEGASQHHHNLAYLRRAGVEDPSPQLPTLPPLPLPLGGIEAIMAAPDPIETRPEPIQLPLSPGIVEDPVEINPTTGLPRHPLDVS